MRIKNRKQFAHRIDLWDDDGANLVDHLAGVADLDVAAATYRAACRRWPKPRSRYGRARAWWTRAGEMLRHDATVTERRPMAHHQKAG